MISKETETRTMKDRTSTRKQEEQIEEAKETNRDR